MTKAPTRKRAFQDLGLDEAGIRDISEELYRRKLDSECGAGTAKRTDDAIAAGSKQLSIRARASIYDKLTRLYLDLFLERFSS